ncbi:hypothetical protein E4P24_10360 [Haloferax sp. AS1]|uniref:hypothetical protein n=1 Tax=Haloferax sp. AS1 TaxID=2562277 RepID=UPI00165EE372|nr:hypothetical protein [Haloferax sp. AS1]MBC9986766.1 hypothetical protein [Haloferax sp. AS1]
MQSILTRLSQYQITDKQSKRVLAGIAFLVAYGVLLQGIILGRYYAIGDLPPHAKGIALEKFFGTWHETMLGFAHQYPIHKMYFGVFTQVLGPLGQNLLFLSLPVGAFIAFIFFGRRFVPEGTALFVAAGVYALNPLTLAEMVNGGTGEFLAYVGGPIVIEYLYRITERDSLTPVLKAGAAFGLFGVIPWTLFWILAPFALNLLFSVREDLKSVSRLVASGGVGILLSIPGVFYLFVRGASISTADGFASHLDWNYADATVLSILRLAGNHGSYALTTYGYNTDPWAAVGLIIPCIALFAVTKTELRFLYPTIGVFVSFAVLTNATITYPLFELFPPLWTLRNMTKILFPVSLCILLLFAAGFNYLLTLARRTSPLELFDFQVTGPMRRVYSRVPQCLLVVLIVVSSFAYVAPMAGAAGLNGTYEDSYAIPEEYDTVANSLDGKVLWAPYSYTTQLRLRATYPNHIGIKSGGLNTGKANGEYVRQFFRSIGAGDRLYPHLSALGVQYVVVDELPQQRYPATEGRIRMEERHGAPWLFGNPTEFISRFDDSAAYTRVMETENLIVYRVNGIDEKDDNVTEQGVHRLYTPQTPSTHAGDTSNLISNPHFEQGLTSWWTNPRSTGTQATAVSNNGTPTLKLETSTGNVVPVAQGFETNPKQAYQVAVNSTGNVSAVLYWYNGEQQADNSNLIDRREYPISELPAQVIAKGDYLSVRIRPRNETVYLHSVSVKPTTVPAAVGFEQNTEGIPGVLIDGQQSDTDVGKTVAVNLPADERASLNPDIIVTDAESVLPGTVVLNDTYRQGAGILVANETVETQIPDDATVTTYEAENGTVVDYWVVGEWDHTETAVKYTSYHDAWAAGANATHLRAFGWANAFTNATTAEITWSGKGVRSPVIGIWGVSWLAIVAGLVYLRQEQNQ